MMSPKRILFRSCVRILEKLTLCQKPKQVCHLSLQPTSTEKEIDIITIAFNNAELIQLQEQFLKKFWKDHYCHIVVDNSTNQQVRDTIFKYCNQEGIAYIGLPTNFLNRVGGSYSHATALNYIYRHVITKRQPWAWGLIDHDLFPTRPISIVDKLSTQPIYGPLRKREECWYLSAILSFFRYDWTKDKKVDFMPVTPYKTYLDSGGGNWYDLYSRLDLSQLSFPNECIEPLREGGDRHSDSLEWFDDKLWLHTINGSCWKAVTKGKDDLVREYLNNILKHA